MCQFFLCKVPNFCGQRSHSRLDAPPFRLPTELQGGALLDGRSREANAWTLGPPASLRDAWASGSHKRRGGIKPLDCILVFSQSAAAIRSPREDAPALRCFAERSSAGRAKQASADSRGGGPSRSCCDSQQVWGPRIAPGREVCVLRARGPPPCPAPRPPKGGARGRSPKFKESTPIFFMSCKAALALLHASNTLCRPKAFLPEPPGLRGKRRRFGGTRCARGAGQSQKRGAMLKRSLGLYDVPVGHNGASNVRQRRRLRFLLRLLGEHIL